MNVDKVTMASALRVKSAVERDQVKLDVPILLLLTNRHNKGILLHFCQQNSKKIAKIKFWTKLAGNGLK